MAFIVFKKVFRTCSSAKERNFKSISESDFFRTYQQHYDS